MGVEVVCLRCGWVWVRRKPRPRQCPNPKCHSYEWDSLPQEEKLPPAPEEEKPPRPNGCADPSELALKQP